MCLSFYLFIQALDRDREEDEPEEFIYPYHLGWYENLKQVFTCTGKPKSDGFTWDIVEGCDQFTFTVRFYKIIPDYVNCSMYIVL